MTGVIRGDQLSRLFGCGAHIDTIFSAAKNPTTASTYVDAVVGQYWKFRRIATDHVTEGERDIAIENFPDTVAETPFTIRAMVWAELAATQHMTLTDAERSSSLMLELSRRRTGLGISQACEYFGFSRRALQNYESGKKLAPAGIKKDFAKLDEIHTKVQENLREMMKNTGEVDLSSDRITLLVHQFAIPQSVIYTAAGQVERDFLDRQIRVTGVVDSTFGSYS